jgi:DNA-binding NarL/FixJ family response regulator
MQHVLIIDDDPISRASVRRATEALGWHALEAADGLQGLDLARRHAAILDLIVLDIHMPQLDGYWTCLSLRDLRPTRPIPILPFTGLTEALPCLEELGCAPALVKPVSSEQIQAAMQMAVGMAAPQLTPSAMLRFTQRHAAQVEQAARRQASALRVAVFASASVTRIGLYHLIAASGVTTILEAASLAVLAQILAAMEVHVLAAAAPDAPAAIVHAQAAQVPLLLLATTVLEGLAVVDSPCTVPLGVVIADEGALPTLMAGLNRVAAGQPYLPRELIAPLAGSPLTAREQAVVVLDLQELPVEAIATRLSLTADSVHRYHNRIYQKLGLRGLVEVRQWAAAWIAQHAHPENSGPPAGE